MSTKALLSSSALFMGIYNRPVAVCNFLHFTVVTLTLAKELGASPSAEIVVGAVIYAAFAVWFGLVLFRRPAGN